MTQNIRFLIGVLAVVLLLIVIFIDNNLRQTQTNPVVRDTNTTQNDSSEPLQGGMIPVYIDDVLIGSINPTALEEIEQASFVDDEEGKTQRGWLLRDIFSNLLEDTTLAPDTTLTIRSSTREKSAQLTWSQIDNPENYVMFDVSGRGTLKLVSKTIVTLDERDEWVQDVDQIIITTD